MNQTTVDEIAGPIETAVHDLIVEAAGEQLANATSLDISPDPITNSVEFSVYFGYSIKAVVTEEQLHNSQIEPEVLAVNIFLKMLADNAAKLIEDGTNLKSITDGK